MIRTMRKLNPSSLDPGSNELYFVGSPNKYLTDPAFVINQETRRVAAVDNISNTGNDPKIKLSVQEIFSSLRGQSILKSWPEVDFKLSLLILSFL